MSSPAAVLPECGPKFSMATMFRTIGVLAIVVSAIAYLFQGFEGVDVAMRHWAYLGLIFVLSLGGFFSQRFFKDSIGSRLFFAMAAVLVPVQLTQVSAMLLTLLEFGQVDNIYALIISASLSISLGAFTAFMGLAILARPYAKVLTLCYFALNVLLLIPLREALPVIAISVAMATVLFGLQLRLFSKHSRFAGFEGVFVRVMLAVPFIIHSVRGGMHISDDFGALMSIFIAAVFAAFLSVHFVRNALTQTILVFASYLVSGATCIGMLAELCFGSGAVFKIPLEWMGFYFAIPVLLLSLAFAELTQNRSIYRAMAMLPVLILAVLSFSQSLAAQCVLVCITLALGFYALRLQSKLILWVSCLTGFMNVGLIIFNAVGDIAAVNWLTLALAGVLLLLLSSVAERFGRSLLNRSRSQLEEVNAWSI